MFQVVTTQRDVYAGSACVDIRPSPKTDILVIIIIIIGHVCGRIREHVAGGAWCPSEPIGKDSTEFLQVDLGRLMIVTLVETQGRFDNGQVGTTAS